MSAKPSQTAGNDSEQQLFNTVGVEDVDADLEDVPTLGEVSADTELGRRRFCQVAGVTAATVATAGVAGTVAGQSNGTINFDSALAHNPAREGTVTVAEHDAADMEQLDYVADDGTIENLETEYGAGIAERPDDDSETPTAHNPVSYNVADVVADEFTAFPRGETFENADGDDEDLSALDSQHWDTSGGLTVSDDGEGLRLSGGDLDTARFTDFTVDSGVARKFIQLAFSVDALPAGASMTVAAEDIDGATASVSIDADGDTATDGVIANSTGAGKVGQVRIGDLADLNDLTAIEVSVAGGSVDVLVHGLNLEKETRWGFGSQEFVNADDELETETIYEPDGDLSVTSIGSFTQDAFADAVVKGVDYSIEQQASLLPASDVLTRREDAGAGYDHDELVEWVYAFRGWSAYDLSTAFDAVTDVVEMSSGRYLGVDVAETASDELETWEDVDDHDAWTDRSSNYGSRDADVQLLGSPASGQDVIVHYEVQLNTDEADGLLTTGGTGAAVGVDGGGGGLGARVWTVIGGLVALLGGYFAYARRKASQAAGR